MQKYTFSDDLYSDFHKDAHGFRPGEYGFAKWSAMTDDEKQAEWEYLGQCMDERSKQAAEDEQFFIKKFEKVVLATIESGAKDRAQAIAWLMDAEDVRGDDEFFCYLNGLPYGYFKVAA
jgi:hypothetical protein